MRALKGLVKLQALVRGFLVRKQATATLHSIQALIRAQATIKSQKSHRLMNSKNEANSFQNYARRSMVLSQTCYMSTSSITEYKQNRSTQVDESSPIGLDASTFVDPFLLIFCSGESTYFVATFVLS